MEEGEDNKEGKVREREMKVIVIHQKGMNLFLVHVLSINSLKHTKSPWGTDMSL